MKTLKLLFYSLLFLGLAGTYLIPTSFSRIMKKEVKKALGPYITINKSDWKRYIWFSHPTNNFGLITSYNPDPKEPAGDENFLCDMWNCVDEREPKDYAAVGTGGGISLSRRQQKRIGLNVFIPVLSKLIGLGSNLDLRKGVSTTIHMGNVHLRKLRRMEFFKYINSLPDNNLIKKSYYEGRLVVVVSDIVVDSLNVLIKVDKNLNPNLFFGLKKKEGDNQENSDDKLKFSLESTSKGEFNLKITQPVIVAVLLKSMPAPPALEMSFTPRIELYSLPEPPSSWGGTTPSAGVTVVGLNEIGDEWKDWNYYTKALKKTIL